MKIPIPLNIPFADLYIEPGKSGVAFVMRSALSPVVGKLQAEATLVLPWNVIVILFLLIFFTSTVIYFRNWLVSLPLISRMAPAHLVITVCVVSVAAFFMGLILTVWKKRNQFTYGIAEIVFGLFSIGAITYFLWEKPELSKFVGMGSGLYVVSRGMGNFADAALAEFKAKRVLLSVKVSGGKDALLAVSEADLVSPPKQD